MKNVDHVDSSVDSSAPDSVYQCPTKTHVDPRLHVPAFNLNKSVRNFNLLAGRSINVFNPDQAGFQIGLILEEVGELIEAVQSGTIFLNEKQELQFLLNSLNEHAKKFKSHHHTGDILRGDRVGILDASIDIGVVTLGLSYSVSNNVDGACREVDRANMDKFPNGVAAKDWNGKVLKPHGWQAPNLKPFVTLEETYEKEVRPFNDKI